MSAAFDLYRHHRDYRRTVPAAVTGAADVHIDIYTDEDGEGRERYAVINGEIHLLTAASLRQMGAELLNAADELDRVTLRADAV